MVELILKKPSAQNVIDMLSGDWTSMMPAGSGLVSTGNIPLFDDPRIAFVERVLGPVQGMDVLELGPLEGAHTYTLHRLGARSVTAIEANPRAFIRCLCVKEVFGLVRAKFLLGNFLPYLEELQSKVDLIVASGVLYHMTGPLGLLDLLCRNTDRLFLWTHYFDAAVIAGRADAAIFDEPAEIRLGSFACEAAVRRYPQEALAWNGFTGGAAPYAVWLSRDGLLAFLKDRGFTSVTVDFDQPDHPNGPALALCARRS